MNYPPSQTPADYTTNQPPAAVIPAAAATPLPPPSYTNPIPPPRHPSPYPSPRRPLFTQTPTPPPPSTTNNISSATVARFPNPNFTNPQQRQQQFNHRPYEDLFRPNGGFVHRQPPSPSQPPPPRSQIHGQAQAVMVAASSNPASAYPPPVRPPTISPSQGFQIHNRSSATFINQMQMLRPNYQQQQQEQQQLLQQQQRQQPPPPQQQQQQKRQQQHPNSGVNAPIRGVPVYGQLPKVASSPSNFPASNGYKHLRGKRKDETVVTIRDRKVRITEGASLYALCRSWLRNGRHEDRQPVNEDSRMRLPRPIPAELIGGRLPTSSEVEEDKDVEASEHLSSEELLRRHIQRAKKVRARLREERSRKIDRYRTRLSLLIPIHTDQLEDDANS